MSDQNIICVDMDGTLIRSDTLWELAILSSRINLAFPFRFAFRCLYGKATAKKWLASTTSIDPKAFPYEERLLRYLQSKREEGSKIVLVTASDMKIANEVAKHVGIFDDVIASDGRINIRGMNKASSLLELYGDRGFIYAGNDRTDLEVWKHAKSAIVVNAGNRLANAAARVTTVDIHLPPEQDRVVALFRSMRCYQWVKNVLVFIPLIAAHKLFDVFPFLQALMVFVAFCMTASGNYMLNDLFDLDVDRRHPKKRKRPFASGAIPLSYGLFGPILIISGILLSFIASWKSGIILTSYTLLSVIYSAFLKQYPLVDVFKLAVLYTLRIYAGGAASKIDISPWLFIFSGFFFLALAFLKRCGEYIRINAEDSARRGYMGSDLVILQVMGIGSSFSSAVVLGMYVYSTNAFSNYAIPEVLWAMVPLSLFWQLRLWLSTSRGYLDDDPIVYASKDWVSQLVAASGVLIYIIASGYISL